MMMWSAWHKGIPAAPIYNGYELATRHDPTNPHAFYHRRIVRNPRPALHHPAIRPHPQRRGRMTAAELKFATFYASWWLFWMAWMGLAA
jgi:hypothetical protein